MWGTLANVCRWIYLFFFNSLWVWIPMWLLYEAYHTFLPALKLQSMVGKVAGTASMLRGATFGGESEDEDEEEEEEISESESGEEGVSVGEVLEGKKVR